MVLSYLEWVQRKVLRLISQTVFELAHTAEDACSVGLELPTLLAHAELNSEPVNGGKSRELSLSGSERCQSDLLREVSEILVRKHRRMPEKLVDNVWLRGVQRHTVMSYVLSRVEYLESEAIQELSLSQETSHRLEPPASLRLQELRNRIKLGNLFRGETYVLLKLVDGPHEFFTRVCFE